jgi:hypothetical protein
VSGVGSSNLDQRASSDQERSLHCAGRFALRRIIVRDSPLFRPWSNTILWIALAGVVLVGAAFVAAPMLWVRTPYVTGEGQEIDQPIKFDHRHHVRDDGVDCLYCHDNARRSPYAGVPATSRCMGCHAQIWTNSPELQTVRASFFEGRPIPWRRVNRLPKFVFFDHSIHLAKGVGCVECHGRVDRMAEVRQVESLTMAWCLGCHRDPIPHIRPPDRLTEMEYDLPLSERAAIAQKLNVRTLTYCSTCHR